MQLAIHDVIVVVALMLPLALIVTHVFQIRHDLRSIICVAAYGIFTVSELLFIGLEKQFFVYHLYIDGVVISAAFLCLINTEPRKITIPPPFVPHFVFFYMVMLGTAPMLPLASGGNRTVLSVVVLVAVTLFGTTVLIKGKVKNYPRILAVLALWLLAHLFPYTHLTFLNPILTDLFFISLSALILAHTYRADKSTYYENSFLFNSQHVVLSMLNDISSSPEYISSVDNTLRRVLETCADTLSASGVALYVVDHPKDKSPILKLAQHVGKFMPLHRESESVLKWRQLTLDRLAEVTFHFGEGVVGAVAQRGQHVLLDKENNRTDMAVMGLDTHRVRNVLAVPMRIKGELYGVIVAQNSKDKSTFDGNDIHLLQALADQAGISVNNTNMYIELTSTVRFREEANIATRIQKQLLPKNMPPLANLNLSVFFEPAKEVGGDYYDFIRHQDGSTGIVIGDVSGKGVPAGMVMAVAKAIVQMVAKDTSQPEEIIKRFGEEMYGNMRSGQFMTLNYVRWDEDARKLSFAGAGHEHLLWFHNKSGRSDRIRAGGLAIGLARDMTEYVQEKELELEKGDVVVLYTDGVTEARDPNKEMYTLRRLQSTLENYAYLLNPDKIRENIVGDLLDFMGETEKYDDITLLVMSVVA